MSLFSKKVKEKDKEVENGVPDDIANFITHNADAKDIIRQMMKEYIERHQEEAATLSHQQMMDAFTKEINLNDISGLNMPMTPDTQEMMKEVIQEINLDEINKKEKIESSKEEIDPPKEEKIKEPVKKAPKKEYEMKFEKLDAGLLFKNFFGEIQAVVYAAISAILFILGSVFIDLPELIILPLKNKADKKHKEYKKNVSKLEDAAPNKSGFAIFLDFLNEKYENLPFVKNSKNKKNSELTIFTLSKDGSDAIKTPQKQMYRYLIKNEEGKLKTGFFAAYSKMDVYSYLQDLHYTIYKIETSKYINFVYGGGSINSTKMKTKDLVFWLTQLSTYLKAGIPLTDSVKVLAQQDKRKKYKALYENLIFELTMGQPFSVALERQGSAFPSLLVNMIKSSELVGNIEDTLDEMSKYYQDVEDTKRAIISAMAYPTVVLIFALVICVFMLTYIVPQFVSVYDSMDADIPALTQAILDFSDFLVNYWVYLVVGIVGTIVTLVLLVKKVKAFRKFFQTICMKIPVVGKLMISKEMSLFASTFATLQKNNVLLTESIEVLAKITSNELYKELELKTINNLIKGGKMSETFKDNWIIPDIAYFMIVTGESTGELAEMLSRVGEFYLKQEKESVGSIKTFIEPVMIISLACIVGFILVGVLVPMFGIYSTVS